MSGMGNLRVVLVEVRNSLNMGAAARAISNFGAGELRVVRPFEEAWREAKSAVGAGELMARAEEFATVGEAVADCSLVVGTTAVGNREIRQPLRSLQKAGPLLRKRIAAGGRVAILFGSEKRGLSNESLSHCHWLLRIPTREEHRSMNLGQAVAVVLYELARNSKGEIRNSRSEVREEGRSAAVGDVEMITQVLLEALFKSGYVAKGSTGTAEGKLRRMLRRFRMEEGDAKVFLGMPGKFW